MKRYTIPVFLLLAIAIAKADIIRFDLSPAGTDKAVGLSPANEVDTVIGSTGSGNEILNGGGITFDTTTRLLSLAVGYGSAAGFTDLTGPATAMHIHGPAGPGTNAAVLIDLSTNHLAAANPSQGGVIFGGVTYSEAQAADLLAGLHYINIHTATNAGGEIRGQLIPVLNHAPTVTCPAAAELECSSSNGATATVTVNVADEDGDALEVIWKINGTAVQTNTVAASTPTTQAAVSLVATFPLGDSEISVTVSDGEAAPSSCTTKVTVRDTTPPDVESVKVNPSVLWPPNHQMVPASVEVKATDACGDVSSKIVSVTSNEPVNGHGDGNTSPDWKITGDLTLELRAERSGPGKGRVYTIKVEVSDEAGNSVTRNVTVLVPHDSGKRQEGSHSPTGQSKALAPARVDRAVLLKNVGRSGPREN
jgi:hypothetical protein